MPFRTYDQIAPQYDTSITRFERWFLGELRTKTLSLLPANARILEVGAGTGLNFVFYPSGVSGAATEPSREMLKLARQKPKPASVTLLQNRVEQLPFAAATFDAAFATLVFCSVNSPLEGFAELSRVVRPGGTIVLLEHVRPGGLLGPLFDLMNLATVPLFGDHMNRRTAVTARAAGLDVVSVETHRWGIINLITCRVESKELRAKS